MPTCLRVSVVYVASACVLAWFTYQRACVPTCQKRVDSTFLHANVPINVPKCQTVCQFFTLVFQRTKSVPILQTLLLRKWNFYTLLLYKRFYILLDAIVIHTIYIYMHRTYKLCYTSFLYFMSLLKKRELNFYFLFFFFIAL